MQNFQNLVHVFFLQNRYAFIANNINHNNRARIAVIIIQVENKFYYAVQFIIGVMQKSFHISSPCLTPCIKKPFNILLIANTIIWFNNGCAQYNVYKS